MQRGTLLMMVSSLTVMMVVAFIVAGCGGGKAPSSAKSDSIIGSGRMGEIVLTIDWSSRSRVIPPSTVRIDVTITGDGLVNPFRDSIQRPPNLAPVVTKVYRLPVGFKHVTAEAKDSNNRTVASGVGTTTLTEGQRTNLEIVMSEITQRTVLVRTFRGKQQAPPNFIAFQDGDGPWQIPQGSGQYILNIQSPDGRYGLAVADVGEAIGLVEVRIFHATVTELSQINISLNEPSPANLVTVSGTVSGIGDNEAAEIVLGDHRTYVHSSNTYSLQVPPGTYDLIAVRFRYGELYGVNKALIKHNIDVSGNTTINIDFNSPEAFVPEIRNAAIGGVASGELAGGEVSFRSHNGTEIRTGGIFEVTPPTIQFSFGCAPTDKQFGNDIHNLLAIAMTETTFRLIQQYFKTPSNISATLPPPFGNASVTVAATSPYTRFTATWDAYPGAQAYFARFGEEMEVPRQRPVNKNQLSQPKRRSRQEISRWWFVGLSVGWLGGQRSYTLPDLSGLSGWDNRWGFPTGRPVPWEVGAIATNRTLQDFANNEFTPVDRLEVRNAGKRGEVTP